MCFLYKMTATIKSLSLETVKADEKDADVKRSVKFISTHRVKIEGKQRDLAYDENNTEFYGEYIDVTDKEIHVEHKELYNMLVGLRTESINVRIYHDVENNKLFLVKVETYYE